MTGRRTKSIFFALLLSCCLRAQDKAIPTPWRYDLRPAIVIYRYTSSGVFPVVNESQTKATYTTHVLVLAEKDGHRSVGLQRNRESRSWSPIAKREKISWRNRGRTSNNA